MVSHWRETGISERFMDELQRYCKKHAHIEKVILFGSRARGDYQNTSDIDLALCTNNLSHSKQNLIEADIINMSTPLRIDILFKDRLVKEKLIVNIMEEGLILYEKGEALREA